MVRTSWGGPSLGLLVLAWLAKAIARRALALFCPAVTLNLVQLADIFLQISFLDETLNPVPQLEALKGVMPPVLVEFANTFPCSFSLQELSLGLDCEASSSLPLA